MISLPLSCTVYSAVPDSISSFAVETGWLATLVTVVRWLQSFVGFGGWLSRRLNVKCPSISVCVERLALSLMAWFFFWEVIEAPGNRIQLEEVDHWRMGLEDYNPAPLPADFSLPPYPPRYECAAPSCPSCHSCQSLPMPHLTHHDELYTLNREPKHNLLPYCCLMPDI